MDVNEYTLEMLVRERLAEARATRARQGLRARARSPRQGLRARVGVALIALGERLAGGPAPRVAPRTIHG